VLAPLEPPIPTPREPGLATIKMMKLQSVLKVCDTVVQEIIHVFMLYKTLFSFSLHWSITKLIT
jgi:hypothetical protein